MSVNNIKYITGAGGELIPVLVQERVQDVPEQPQYSYAAYHVTNEDDGHDDGEGDIITIEGLSHGQGQDLNNAGNIIIDHNGEAMTLQQLIECSVMEEVQTVEEQDGTQPIYEASNYEEQQDMQQQDAERDRQENLDIIYEIESQAEFGTNNELGQNNNPAPTAQIPSYFCPHCGNCYTAPGSLKLHMRACLRTRSEVPIKDRQCNECKKIFNSAHYLKDHMLIHVNKKTFRCQRCYRKFIDEEKYNAHTEAHEQQDKLDAAAEAIAAQEGGGKKIVKEYICSFCSEVFMVAFDVGQVRKRYACDVCREKFSNKEALLQHKEMTTTKREFTCDRCGRKFVFEGFLQRHQPTCDGTLKRRGGAKS